MTDLLKKAFDAASQLPDEEQDAVAEWLLTELASEEGWLRWNGSCEKFRRRLEDKA